ncbi:DUF58 domain-containing protein [Thermostilla marina]
MTVRETSHNETQRRVNAGIIDQRIVRWVVLGGVLWCISLLVQSSALAIATYVLLATAVLCRIAVRHWATSVAAERRCNIYSASIGDRVTVLVRVVNRSRLPIPWSLLEDILPVRAIRGRPPRLKVTGKPMAAVSIGPGRAVTAVYQVECLERGFYQLGPLIVEVGDPFGLERRYRIVTEPHFLLVYPRVVTLEEWDIATRKPVGEVRLSHRLFEDPTRISGVREYQAGDPLNRIHWRATARTGTLHSKLFEPSVIAGATILLDFHKETFSEGEVPVRPELAVRMTASLAHALAQMNEQIGFISNGWDAVDLARLEGWDPDPSSRLAARRSAEAAESVDRLAPIVVPTRRGIDQFQRILEMLARLELSEGLPFRELVHETIQHIPQNTATVVLLSTVSEEHLVAVEMLHRRGIPVTLIINNHREEAFARAAAYLGRTGVDLRVLTAPEDVASLCRRYVWR